MQIKVNNVGNIILTSLPNSCPFCHNKITPLILSSSVGNRNIEVFFKCPNQSCKKSFIAYYTHSYSDNYDLLGTSIGYIKKVIFSEYINEISPFFVKIYNEANFAENNNLMEICGVGYRKALEFLIKDYLITKNPENTEDLKDKFLGKCINDNVSDLNIKKVSKRAVWLGNDETHYVRKWENKDLTDLKKLIDLTIHWIEMEHLTNTFEEEMPE